VVGFRYIGPIGARFLGQTVFGGRLRRGVALLVEFFSVAPGCSRISSARDATRPGSRRDSSRGKLTDSNGAAPAWRGLDSFLIDDAIELGPTSIKRNAQFRIGSGAHEGFGVSLRRCSVVEFVMRIVAHELQLQLRWRL
jgi:hypothetical protein